MKEKAQYEAPELLELILSNVAIVVAEDGSGKLDDDMEAL